MTSLLCAARPPPKEAMPPPTPLRIQLRCSFSASLHECAVQRLLTVVVTWPLCRVFCATCWRLSTWEGSPSSPPQPPSSSCDCTRRWLAWVTWVNLAATLARTGGQQGRRTQARSSAAAGNLEHHTTVVAGAEPPAAVAMAVESGLAAAVLAVVVVETEVLVQHTTQRPRDFLLSLDQASRGFRVGHHHKPRQVRPTRATQRCFEQFSNLQVSFTTGTQ
jgi:hypothetical protein